MLTISLGSLVSFVLSLAITLVADFFILKPINKTYVPCPAWPMRYMTGYEM